MCDNKPIYFDGDVHMLAVKHMLKCFADKAQANRCLLHNELAVYP